uniref:Putative e3 ubiquitin-protein ligase traip-like linepithema humile n=1 Tax=Lutzomyia longipalpis TaxID=7200 RepID=A0A1B0GI05_LUTLO
MNVICSICTESLRPNVDFSANSCGHSFHSQCIQQWIQRNPTCPQCRKVCTKKHLCRLFLTMTEQQRAMQQDDVMRQKEKELKDQKTQWAVLNQKYQNKVKAHEQTIHEVQILRSDKQKSSKIISNLENRLTEVNSIIANNCQMKEEVRTLRTSKENSEQEKQKFSNTTIESLRLNFKEKLKKLRQWQEEQEKTLIEKQCKQRKLLAQEQDKLYKMLGHSQSPDAGSSEKGGIDGEFIERLSGENMMSALIAKSRQEVQKRSPINKKPFLKRGEGLTSRFRVHPDHFNLKNIPKCKNPPGKRKMKLTNLQQTEVAEDVQEVLDDSQKPPADGEVSANILDPQCWKKLLEAMNLNPDNASRLFQEFAKFTLNNSTESSSSKKSCDLDNLSLFELLEEKLQNSSLSSNSSTVRRL